MRKISLFVIGLAILAGCTKKEEPLQEVSFMLNVSGFNITTSDFGSLKSIEALFDGFEHKYTGGTLNFEAPSGVVYGFDTQDTPIDEFVFSLTPGTYSLTGAGLPGASVGRDGMIFNIGAQEITITESTTAIDVVVTPTCALILVSDALAQVSSALIRPVSPPPSWVFFTDGIFYYTYIEPTSGYYAEITKLDASTLTMQTGLLQVGYVYQIEVTDGSGSMVLNLDPLFTEAETVVW